MFKILKLLFLILIATFAYFLYWFLPKYSYVNSNPSFCVNLKKVDGVGTVLFCGDKSNADQLFNINKNEN